MCRGIGRFLGHKFEPRYHVYPSVKNPAVLVKVYVCDICPRCGCRSGKSVKISLSDGSPLPDNKLVA